MYTSRLNILLIPLAMALAVYLPISGRPTPTPAATSSGSQTGQTATSSSEGAPENPASNGNQPQGDSGALLCDFFGLKRGEQKDKLALQLRGKKIELLIATLPDPRDSPLSDTFDRHLDAIQRAIEAAGYIYDRASLPWLEKDDEKNSAERNVVEMYGPTPLPRYRQIPGVVLFRSRFVSEEKLLLLFLVGETPTAGIHKFAFWEALDQVTRLSNLGEPNQSSASSQSSSLEMHVIGPTFTGSSVSLALAIRQWMDSLRPEKRPFFKIISGGATSINREYFQKLTNFPNRVEFSTTVINNGQAFSALRYYLTTHLQGPGSSGPRIAILREGNTGSGTSLLKLPPEDRSSILFLTFPLHISQLRSASEKARAARPTTAPQLSLSSGNVLPLPIDGDSEPKNKDVIPTFSQLEAVSSELVLANLLSEIKRERIQYLGLIATDVRDRVFLARAIREHCPNVRLFLFGADQLYLHDKANLDFRGVLLLTSYPLLLQNQLWTLSFTGDKSLLQFPSSTAQGTYNATLAFLDPDLMLEYGSPFETSKDGQRHPALWLSIVGRDGLWPVTLLKDNGSGKAPGEFNTFRVDDPNCVARASVLHIPTPFFAHIPTPFFALQLLSLFCLIPPGVLLLQIIGSRLNTSQTQDAQRQAKWLERITSSSLTCVFGDKHNEIYKYRFNRRPYLIAACASLLTISLLIYCVSILPVLTRAEIRSSIAWEQKWLALPVAGCGLILIVIMLLWLLENLVSWMWRTDAPRKSRIEAGVILAVGALVFVLLILVTLQIGRSPEERFFFFLRSTNLASGVSPLAPMLLAGLGGFISFFCVVRRLNLAERMARLSASTEVQKPYEVFLNFDQTETKSFTGIARLEDRVMKLLVCGEFSLPYWGPVILVVVVPYFYAFFLRFAPLSVEGGAFDWFFRVVFLVSPLILAFAFLRFLWIWHALRQLLRRLSLHTLFSQIAGDAGATRDKDSDELSSAFPNIVLMAPASADVSLSHSVHQAELFWLRLEEVAKQPTFKTESAHYELLQSDLRNEINNARDNLRIALEFEAEGKWQDSLQRRNEAQQNLSRVSNLIARMLEPRWPEAADQSWARQGAFFLVSHVAFFLRHIFSHLRNLVGMGTAGLVLILLAANSYPFQPREPLLLFCWIMVLTSVAITILIFMQIGRDKVICLISGRVPGRLNWNSDLIFRVLTHAALPIIVLLGAQFPDAVRQIFDWLSGLQGMGH